MDTKEGEEKGYFPAATSNGRGPESLLHSITNTPLPYCEECQ